LNVSGEAASRSLEPEFMWKKENVLAVYLSGKIPNEMKEDLFHQKVPASIQNDRDVLLARLDRQDFVDYYYRSHSASASFCIPEQFLADKEIVTALVQRYPQVLMQDVLPGVFRL
jgi:hypothetical protein